MGLKMRKLGNFNLGVEFRGRQNEEGCTPLDYAATEWKVKACTVLVHAACKQELPMENKDG